MTDAYQATLDPRFAPQGDPLAARPPSSDALSGDFNQNMQRMQQGGEKLQQIQEAKQRALNPLISQASQMGKDLRQFQGNPPVAQPLPPTPQRNQPGEDEQWLMAAMVLGAIGGAFTRQHVTNGLAAMTGALEGYQAGSKEKFEQNLKLWKAESEKAKEANEAANTRYRQILESRKLAWDQKMQEIQLVAAQYKDLATMQLVQNGQVEKMGDMMLRRDEATAKMEQAKLQMQRDFARMQETERHNRAMEAARMQSAQTRAGGGGRSDDAIDLMVERALAGDPKATQGMGVRDVDQRRFADRLAQVAKERGLDAEEIRRLQLQYTGEQAYQRTAGGMGARVENAVNEVEQLVPQALDASRALPRGQWVPINKLMQAYQSGTSDPRYNDFMVANISLMNAYGRAMNPQGVPRVTEKAEARAEGLLSMATSQQAYETQVRRLWLEVQASKRATAATRQGGITPKPLEGAPVPPMPGAAPSGGGPPVGTEDQGYRFKGGDPKDKSNWEPVSGGDKS
jgi:hypothetical protein